MPCAWSQRTPQQWLLDAAISTQASPLGNTDPLLKPGSRRGQAGSVAAIIRTSGNKKQLTRTVELTELSCLIEALQKSALPEGLEQVQILNSLHDTAICWGLGRGHECDVEPHHQSIGQELSLKRVPGQQGTQRLLLVVTGFTLW